MARWIAALSRTTAVVGILAVLLFLTAQPVAAHGGGHHGGSNQPYDVTFMTSMIPHHYSAVIMADLCTGRAPRASLRSLCQQMKEDQTREIRMMQGWLREWYGIRQPVSVDRMGQRMIDRLRPLTGAKFEAAFLHEMIRHHRMAVMMGRQCLENARHDALKTLCGNIVKTQTAEIRIMARWLCEWYDQCGGMTGGHH